MLKIRLQRTGRKNEAQFRLVVTEAGRGPKSGKVIEFVGHYNPKLGERKIDAERVKYWLSVGAQPSDTVHNMLVAQNIIEGKKRNNLPYKKPYVDPEAVKKAAEEAKKKEEAEAKAKADAEAAAKAQEEAKEAAAKAAEEAANAPAEEAPAPAEETAPEVPSEEVATEEAPATE